ncbi:amino acid adenylation domain-containing protein [Kribbella sp. NPDC006257]|uniref:non-ribosomal peptide synthetase/type I polyketide synthase n=1 Tax=Kribbella sp. NPDC006257 TaxID=3156738 RepID=UPI0033B1C131
MVRNGADRPAISTGPALMIPAGYPRDLPSALLRAARDFGTSGVVEIGPDGRETRLDFPTLLELAARILAGLRANGVRAGDPAVVHCTEPVGFFAAFWACTLGGIRPLLMAPAAEGDRTEEGRERLRKVTDLLGWTVLIGRPSDLPDDLGLPVLDPDALAGHEPTSEFHRPAADDVAVLMMSSGSSTGTPKIIQLTHRGLVEFAAGTPAMLPVRPGQTTLNWLPLDHSGAFLLYHLLPVFAGCTNIHVATDWVLANPLRWLDLMDAHRVNHSWAPNFGYRLATAAIAGEPDRHWDLSALRSLVSGGEQITVPVVSEFLRLTNRFGVVPETFVAAWGMTETVTGITFARPGLTPNVHRVRIPPTGVVEWVDQRSTAGKVAVARPGKSRVEAPGVLSLVSVGTPAPGATVRIVGPNGAVLPEGRIGQLQIASARVTPGYLGNPDADRAAFPAGNWPARKWLATGDQAFITGGQVVITGRDSERIILNGQNYYAHDIETVAASVPGAELGLVAACGLADAATGTERLLIFFAVPETADPTSGVADSIRAVLHDRLGLAAQVVGVPRRHFPTTPGGKILRPLLKQRFVDGSLNAPTSPYGEPLRANTPYAAPAARTGSFDDDAEQTTELPVVRLAWRRSLADSIPTPPQRPTLGAPRPPADLPESPADSATEPPLDTATPEPPLDTATPESPFDAGTTESPALPSDAATTESPEPPSDVFTTEAAESPTDALTADASRPTQADLAEPTAADDARLAEATPAHESTAETPSTDPAPTNSPSAQPLADADPVSALAEAAGVPTTDLPTAEPVESLATDFLDQAKAADHPIKAIAPETPEEAGHPTDPDQPSAPEPTTSDPDQHRPAPPAPDAPAASTDLRTPEAAEPTAADNRETAAAASTEATNTPEPTTPPVPAEPVESTEGAEDAKSSDDDADDTTPVEGGEPSGVAEADVAHPELTAESAETATSADATGSTEMAESTETLEPARTAKSADVPEPAEMPESAQTADPAEAAEPSEPVGTASLAVENPADVAEATGVSSGSEAPADEGRESPGADEPAGGAEPGEPAEPAATADESGRADAVEPEGGAERVEPAESAAAETARSAAVADTTESEGAEVSERSESESGAGSPGLVDVEAVEGTDDGVRDESAAVAEVGGSAEVADAVEPAEHDAAGEPGELVAAAEAAEPEGAESVASEEADESVASEVGAESVASEGSAEPVAVAESTAGVEPTEASEDEQAQSTDADQPAAAFQLTDAAESTDVTGPADVAESTDAGEFTHAAASTDSDEAEYADSGEETDPAESADAGESTDVAESTDTDEAADAAQFSDTGESVDASETADVADSTDADVAGFIDNGVTESVDASEEADAAESVDASEEADAAESADAGESTDVAESTDTGEEADAAESTDAGEEAAAGESADATESAGVAESVGAGDEADADESADAGESTDETESTDAGGSGNGVELESAEQTAMARAGVHGTDRPPVGDFVPGLTKSGAENGQLGHKVAPAPAPAAGAGSAGGTDGAESVFGERVPVVASPGADGGASPAESVAVGSATAEGAAVAPVEVAALAADGEVAEAASGEGVGEWVGRVVGVFRGVLGDEVDERTGLYELGVDSVAMVRVHTGLQEVLGLEFPRSVMFEHESILALSNYLEERAGEFRSTAAAHSSEQAAPPRTKTAKKQAVEPIAIIGLAARFPGADTLEQFWDNLAAGVESIRRFTPDEVTTKDAFGNDELVAVSGALEDVESFDAEFFGLSDREAELTDPAQRIFLEVCQHALEHGGHAGAAGRIGIFAGSGMNLYTQQNQPPDFLATRVAYRLGLTGPAIGVQAAWSSSLVAVHLACQALRSGDADLALAGAAAVHVPQATGYHASPESILSPTGHIRVFDAAADGTVGGNGVAAVLLKRLDQAVTDGDTVYAVIRGSAVSNENDQADLVERALEKAGVPAESLSYIEANATGTAAADASEFKALASVLRKHTDATGFCTIGSVKPNIGHLDSAAGMAGLIKTVLMLQHRTLVPTINQTKVDPDLQVENSPFVIGTTTRDWEAGAPLRAGVSALDVGGTSAHVILEEAPRQVRRGDDGPVVLPLSAPDADALTELVELFRADLEHGTGHRLIDLASTAALGRPAHRQRLAVAGSSEEELAEALGTAQAVAVPRGGPGPLGFAFTGQGAARRGMAAGLAARFPVFRSVLDECDKVYAEEFGGSLLELLLTTASTAEGIWPTETAQPALFAFEVALARLWQSFGVQPALVVGHSVGEYAALCVAGALSLADGVRLTAKRGELMQRGTVPGAMVAVRADADRVRELAQTSGVEIAAGNGPQSFVLTGTEVIVGQLAEQLDRLEVSWQRLDVDRAFHSSLVDPILADFAKVVAEIKLRPLRMPMVSSWSGELLESGTALDSDYLVGQLRQPVLFGDAVEALTAAGCRRFLELGPDAVLSPAGRRIAPNSTWIPAQRLGQDPVLATMNGLAELYEQGTEITWSKVYPNAGRVPLPLYPFRRVHHPVDTTAAPAALLAPAETTATPADAGTTARPVMRAEGGDARVRPALKKIPLDPPSPENTTEPPHEDPEEHSPFALPAENTNPIELTVTELATAAQAEASPANHGADADALAAASSSREGREGREAPNDAESPAATGERPGASSDRAVGEPASVAERYRESLEVVLDLTGEQLGLDPYDVTVDHTFAELGADSLSMLRVVEEVGQRFEVELAVSELFDELDTPHKLASAVASRNVPGGEVDPFDLLGPAEPEPSDPVEVKDSRTALAVLGSGLAELAAKVDAAAAATSEADLPGSGMAALMSQQLRVAGQLVDGVTKLMHEQLALLNETTARQTTEPQAKADAVPAEQAAQNKQPADQAAKKQADEARAATKKQADDAQAAKKQADDAQAAKKQAADEAQVAKEKYVADLEFWHGVLAGAQPLVLPSDQPRPAARPEVASVELNLDASLGDAVFAFSRDRKVSPLMTMLAAVGTVLGRFAAQDDITIGTAALRGAGAQNARALPLRIDLSGEPDLGDLAQRVRELTIAAFDHAAVDLAVLEQDPLFQVLVEFEPGDEELAPELDLRLRLAHHSDGIRCTADYRAGLFDKATIERLLQYLEAVLRRAITEPRLSLPELMLPTEPDRKLLAEFEGEPPAAGPIGRVRRNAVVAGELSGLHTLFEQQVARTPDATAVIQGDRELTYAELNRRSNAVAWQLVDLGVKPGQLVAVRVARGAELVVAVLAVLKSGAAYLPLDPGVPESRWAFMIGDSGAVALVGDDAALADRLGLRLVPVAAADGDLRAKQAPPVRAAADDVAYCIYTSGSTGNPKGVAVPHRGPVNLVRHYLRTRRSLRTLQWTSFGFDVHVQELFTALASGAALVVIGEDDRYDPDEVVAALTKYEVERLFMTFTPLTALLATMPEMPKLPALREIVAGGEAMVLTHGIKEFLAAHPECLLFNEYGPTEASVVTTIHQVDPAEDRPSIGRPIDGVVVRLLDEALRPVPVGAVGEIHLGGAAVAQGYLGRPDETEAAFVNDPAHPGGRLYRSRDLGRWRADGTLDYLGRVDDQVKIRGHRVEPGETEYVLADLPGVIDAVVVANTDPAGDTCLIGYVVLEDDDPAVLARLLLQLTKELPIYLVPADLIPIDELPLDASGKLDRPRLPDPEWLKN